MTGLQSAGLNQANLSKMMAHSLPKMAPGSGAGTHQAVARTADSAQMSLEAQNITDAVATTARRDASLEKLANGPVNVNGTMVSQHDGYKAVSDASWERFNGAYNHLPEKAKAAIQDQAVVVQSDWVKEHGAERFKSASPEAQQELKWMWTAQAAGNYGNSNKAEGAPSDLIHLADGSRQYLQSRAGYLEHGGEMGH